MENHIQIQNTCFLRILINYLFKNRVGVGVANIVETSRPIMVQASLVLTWDRKLGLLVRKMAFEASETFEDIYFHVLLTFRICFFFPVLSFDVGCCLYIQ